MDSNIDKVREIKDLLENVANWRVQPYAGARYECLFCGSMREDHNDGCISIDAKKALPALSAIDTEAKIKRIEELETELESARKDRRIAWDDANKAEAALKAIDPGAIRREMLLRDALDRMYTMVSEPDFPTVPNKYYHHVLNANRVLSAEPAQDDGKLRFRCRDCNSEFDESVIEYCCDDEDGEGDYIGECPVCGSRNLAEVKRRIEEAKE